MRVGFKVAPVASRIWQGFPLILIVVTPCLFKGISDSIYQKVPQSPISFRRRSTEGSGLGALRNLHRTLRDNLFSGVPVDYKRDIGPWDRLLMMGPRRMWCGRSRCYFELWLWISCSCVAVLWRTTVYNLGPKSFQSAQLWSRVQSGLWLPILFSVFSLTY